MYTTDGSEDQTCTRACTQVYIAYNTIELSFSFGRTQSQRLRPPQGESKCPTEIDKENSMYKAQCLHIFSKHCSREIDAHKTNV